MSGNLSFGTSLLAIIDHENTEQPESSVSLRYVILKGKKIIDSAQCSPEQLPSLPGGQRYFSILSNLAYFERSEITAPKANMLEISARRFIDSESIFNEPYRLRYNVTSQSESRFTTDILALPEVDYKTEIKDLAIEEHPVTSLYTVESSIAALIKEVTDKVVIIFWARNESFLSLLVENGSVLFKRSDRVNHEADFTEETGQNKYEKLISSGQRDIEMSARQIVRNDVERFICLGDLVDADLKQTWDIALPNGNGKASSDKDEKTASEKLEQDLLALFDAQGTSVHDKEILCQPELYGLTYVNPAFNLLDSNYRQTVKSHSTIIPFIFLMYIAGIILLGMGGFNFYEASSSYEKFDKQKKIIRIKVTELSSHIPSHKTLDTLQTIIDYSEKEKNELRIDRFLAWLTKETPDGILITSLEIKTINDAVQKAMPSADPFGRGGGGGGGGGGTPNMFAPKDDAGGADENNKKTFEITLACDIDGNYEEAKNLSIDYVKKLSKKSNLSESSFEYLPYTSRRGKAILTSTMNANPQDF
jgi:hypothetical protein